MNTIGRPELGNRCLVGFLVAFRLRLLFFIGGLLKSTLKSGVCFNFLLDGPPASIIALAHIERNHLALFGRQFLEYLGLKPADHHAGAQDILQPGEIPSAVTKPSLKIGEVFELCWLQPRKEGKQFKRSVANGGAGKGESLRRPDRRNYFLFPFRRFLLPAQTTFDARGWHV